MHDPDYYDDDYSDNYNDDFLDDTLSEFDEDNLFDDVIDNIEQIEKDPIESKSGISSTTLGIALALADEIRDEERERRSKGVKPKKRLHDVDENTDKENMEKFMSLSTRTKYKKRLRPFEQYIDDICKGKRPLFPDTDNDLY
jgi:hypothetical protein